MQALVFHGARRMSLDSVAVPAPAPDQVLVRVTSVGICGSDVHGFAGETGRRLAGTIMGHEIAGVVHALGAAVDGCAVGDTVCVNPVVGCGRCAACAVGESNRCDRVRVIGVSPDLPGGLADYVVAPASNLVRFHSAGDRPPLEASLVEPLAVGLNAVRRAGVRAGDRVAVIGLGMIGLACVWAALRDGAAAVYAGDADASRLLGVEPFAGSGDVRPVDLSGSATLRDRLRDHGSTHVDAVIDAVGVSATVAGGLDVLRPGGTLALVGMGAPRLELTAYNVSTAERTIAGSFCYTRQVFAECAAALMSGEVDARLFIDDVISSAQAPAAFRALADGARSSVKTVVTL